MSRMFGIAGILGLALLAPARGEEPNALIGRQKQRALEIWKALQSLPAGPIETENLLVLGSVPEARLKTLAAQLEKQYQTAWKALQFAGEEKPWKGKLAVHVFAERPLFRSLIRQVDQRSPEDVEVVLRRVADEYPVVAFGPGKDAASSHVEQTAQNSFAGALLLGRAKSAQLPEWMIEGFGRATRWQAENTPPTTRKKLARELAKRYKGSDAWNDSAPPEVRLVLGSSMADFLFYGKGLPKPSDFLLAFVPTEEKPMKTLTEAFTACKLTVAQIDAAYLRWLRAN